MPPAARPQAQIHPAWLPLPKEKRPLFGFRVEAEWKDLRMAKGSKTSWEDIQRKPHLTNTTFFTTDGWNRSRASWAGQLPPGHHARAPLDRGLVAEADAHLRWDMARPSPFISFFSDYGRVLRFRDSLIMKKQAFNIVIIAVWLRDEEDLYDASALASYLKLPDLSNYEHEYLLYDSISVNKTIGAFGKLYPEIPPSVEGFLGRDGKPVKRNPSPVRGNMDKGKVTLKVGGKMVQVNFPLDYAKDASGKAWTAPDVTPMFMKEFCSPLVRDQRFLEVMRTVLVLRMAGQRVDLQEDAASWKINTLDARRNAWVGFAAIPKR
ncbi:hypothetical protein F5883DRAFT_543715 [Diaporthe sp. PMI_573]|nr:hypothetical protein F5883DRAFT_543715 [Diaporthaceae sp. PMI_573]